MVGTSGVYNVTQGVQIGYRVNGGEYDNSGIYSLGRGGRKMFLTFEDIDGILHDQTINIIAATPDANCYMAQAGGSLKIPLRKLFWVWEKELGEPLDHRTTAALNPRAEVLGKPPTA